MVIWKKLEKFSKTGSIGKGGSLDSQWLAVLQTHIPLRLLQSHYAEQNSTVFGKREVILSLYPAGE